MDRRRRSPKSLLTVNSRTPVGKVASGGLVLNRGEVMYLNELLDWGRLSFMKSALDGKKNRDLDKECGYNPNPTVREYREVYLRNGYGARVVNFGPDECWKVPPEVYDSEDEGEQTPFEKKWEEFVTRLNLWDYMHRVDRLSGIGTFAVLLLGYDDGGRPETAVPGIGEDGKPAPKRPGQKPFDLVYLRPFDQYLVKIKEKETDPANPRFNLPKLYEIEMEDPDVKDPFAGNPYTTTTLTVHWSRILHVPSGGGLMSSDVFGLPEMRNVFDYLQDIRKVLGSSAEMFFKGGFPGISFESMPEFADGTDFDLDSVQEQMDRYQNGFQRFIALDGVKANVLPPNISDPTPFLRVNVESICTTKEVPVRVFMGSESGHLASDQDTLRWNGRVMRRRKFRNEPWMIDAFARRNVMAGVLPPPRDGKWKKIWVDLNTLTDKDLADVGLKRAQAILQYVTSGSETIMPPLFFYTDILGIPRERAKAIIKALAATQKVTKQLWDPKLQRPQASGTGGERRPAPRNAQGGGTSSSKRSRKPA